MIDARSRWNNAKSAQEWLGLRLDKYRVPHQLAGVAFFEALLIVCIRTIAKSAGRKRAHEVLDLAAWEVTGGEASDG